MAGIGMYQQCITAVALSVCAYTDVRYRKVYGKVAAVYVVLAAGGWIVCGKKNLCELLLGLLPGAVCLSLSWITREALGYGDSMLILACGLSLGLWQCLSLSAIAFFLAGVWGAVLLIRHRGDRKRTFPFVPFLLAALFVLEFLQRLGK